MTREDAKKTLQDMWECLFNEMTNHTFEDLKEHGMLDNYSKAFEMALSALSTDGEYIKKEDAITAFELSQHKGIGDGRPSFYTLIKQAQSYTFPDSTENKEIKEPTLLESFKDGTGKVTEIWAVKGKLQIRTHGTIHNCNGTFGNDISVKSVNNSILVFPNSSEDNTTEWVDSGEDDPECYCKKCGQEIFKVQKWFKFCPTCGRRVIQK